MRQFYTVFKIWSAVRAELSWSHYKLLIKIGDDSARDFYLKEAIDNKGN